MSSKRTFPAPVTLLMCIIIMAAISTWLIPAGQYHKLSYAEGKSFVLTSPEGVRALPLSQKTLDSLQLHIPVGKFVKGDIRKPVSVPGTYNKQESNPQGFIDIMQAPVKGIFDSIDIILFILFTGGFMFIFNETRAIEDGVTYLSHRMKGREPLLIVVLVALFSFLRASYGMEEEALVFYPILVPLFLAAGYDLMVPLAIIFGGTTIGGISGFSNPFSVIVASNSAGINWQDGLYERLILFVIVTVFMSWYILRYAAKVKADPAASLVFLTDGPVESPYAVNIPEEKRELGFKTRLLLVIYMLTFISMIVGVVFFNWWTVEMSALFLGSSILVGILSGMKEKVFVREFVKGCGSLLGVAFIVGVARGVTVILNEGNVSDSILFYTSQLVQGFPPALFIVILMFFFLFFSLFISSSSGMAVLTMPIMGALAIIVNIPGREIVNAYVYGINIMCFMSPTSLLLPSLALVNVSVKAWTRFITPVLIFTTLLCTLFLVIGIYL